MFIQTEATPNPNALKFLPVGENVIGKDRSGKFFKKDSDEDRNKSILADSLFEIEGVEDVFLGSDFITVGKKASVEWPILKSPIISAIQEFYASGQPIINEIDTNPKHRLAHDDDEVVKKIIQLLDTRVRPAVAQDGGDIIFHSYKEGIVYLEMFGACSGCPSSTATLKMGIENMLRHYIPEVKRVEPI